MLPILSNLVSSLRVYNDTNTLEIRYINRSCMFNLSKNHVTALLRTFYIPFMCKLHIYGAASRLYLTGRRGYIVTRFGQTHRICIYARGIFVIIIKHSNVRMFSYDSMHLRKVAGEFEQNSNRRMYKLKGMYLDSKCVVLRSGKVELTTTQ